VFSENQQQERRKQFDVELQKMFRKRRQMHKKVFDFESWQKSEIILNWKTK